MLKTSLTPIEQKIAALVANERWETSRAQGLVPGHGPTLESVKETDLLGALGEVALCKALGVYWTPTVNSFHSPDVLRLQIRTTNHPSGRLIVRSADADDEAFVLVCLVGTNEYQFPGWLMGFAAKQPKWFTDAKNGREPAYFVPRADLQPIAELSF